MTSRIGMVCVLVMFTILSNEKDFVHVPIAREIIALLNQYEQGAA